MEVQRTFEELNRIQGILVCIEEKRIQYGSDFYINDRNDSLNIVQYVFLPKYVKIWNKR